MKEEYFLNRKVQSVVTNNYSDYEKFSLFNFPKNTYQTYLPESSSDENKKKKRILK